VGYNGGMTYESNGELTLRIKNQENLFLIHHGVDTTNRTLRIIALLLGAILILGIVALIHFW